MAKAKSRRGSVLSINVSPFRHQPSLLKALIRLVSSSFRIIPVIRYLKLDGIAPFRDIATGIQGVGESHGMHLVVETRTDWRGNIPTCCQKNRLPILNIDT